MQVPVLDQGFVRLVEMMGSDAAIVRAARVSYGEGTKTVREDAALIDYLMRHRHTSPFEMVEFVFHVRAPIFVARQWFRHRTASYNEVSGRYSVLEPRFYRPATWRRQAKHNRQGSEGALSPTEARLVERLYDENLALSYETYRQLLDVGVAREQARLVLPLALYTEFYVKQDLHNLFHFLKLRLAEDAQLEIREYAKAIAEIVKEKVPLAWAAFEEHVLCGARLSKTEREVLAKLVDREAYAEALRAQGLKKSRVREALKKIWN